jgi:hypothetical protein
LLLVLAVRLVLSILVLAVRAVAVRLTAQVLWLQAEAAVHLAAVVALEALAL